MAEPKPIVLLGSSRSNGETHRAVNIACGNDVDLIDLQSYDFSPYDYNNANRNDDFLKIIDLLIPRDTIIFATPVYWYAMSAQMKVLFDRLSDLITIEKQRGRALAGKTAWLIATGTDEGLPEGFEVPLKRTCAYFDIHYRGACYLYTNSDPSKRAASEERMKEFGLAI